MSVAALNTSPNLANYNKRAYTTKSNSTIKCWNLSYTGIGKNKNHREPELKSTKDEIGYS